LSSSNHHPTARGCGELPEGFSGSFHSIYIVVANAGESSNTLDDKTKKIGQLKKFHWEMILFSVQYTGNVFFIIHTYMYFLTGALECP